MCLFMWCLCFDLVFCVLSWCDVFDIRCIYYITIIIYYTYYTLYICYYYIIYYTYTTIILSYTILSSISLLFPSSVPLPIYILFSSSPPLLSSSVLYSLPFLSLLSSVLSLTLLLLLSSSSPISSFKVYVSVLTYGYLYSLQIFPTITNLTPHVLSEWMVEVCGAYLYRVVFWWKVIVVF